MYTSIFEEVVARDSYRKHTGKFIVRIGRGLMDEYDYCAIIPDKRHFVVLVKHNTSVVAFDGIRFIKEDYSHPLNYRKFDTADEAYNKLMRWIGKMVKKDVRGRYYTDTRYHDYAFTGEEFDSNELNKIAKEIRTEL